MGGDATGERGIVVDVKFQEVEKGVGDFGNGAVDIFFFRSPPTSLSVKTP